MISLDYMHITTSLRPFIPYARQSIHPVDIEAVSKSLSNDIITRGKQVETFERAVAEYCNARYAVVFNSGSTALHAAYYAAEVGPNDIILTTPNTFVATLSAGVQRKATPVFVDIDKNTGNLNLEDIAYNLAERRLSRGRAVIVPVHFSGIPVDMEQLNGMIRSPGAIVIEDAAHAIGSCYADGQKVGCCAWSDMTMFSMHAVKTITTGEGGMVLTNDENLFYKLRQFRNNGIERDLALWENDPQLYYEGYYEIKELTGGYNFTEMQATLGLSQLQRIEEFIAKRQALMDLYRSLLADMPHLKFLTPPEQCRVAYHLCVVQINFPFYKTTRSAVIQALKDKNIGTQVHYIPVYRHPFFKKICTEDISPYFTEMEDYFSQALTLPLYVDLTQEEVEYVVSSLKEILKK